MKRTISKMLGITALAIAGICSSFLAATPALAQASVPLYVTCTPYDTGNVKYPTDGASTTPPVNPDGHAYRCKNNNTGVQPSDSRADTAFRAVSVGYSTYTFPANVKAHLRSNNVLYYIFNNQKEANNYFAHTAPYNGIIFKIADFNAPGARCGNTGMGWNLTTRFNAVSIYDNCEYGQGTPSAVILPNPSLDRTALHETGHVFDFTFSSILQKTGDVRSQKPGFQSNANYDVTKLTPSNWASLSATQRDLYVCRLFSAPYKPSGLEKDTGATTYGGPGGEVCTTSSPQVRYPYYKTAPDKTPQAIAIEKIPYFIPNGPTPSFTDTFAELFVVEAFSTGSPAAFLQMTDRILGNNAINYTQSGVTYPRAMDCTRAIVRSYILTLAAPASLPAGCQPGAL